jgi:hypothetical protein
MAQQSIRTHRYCSRPIPFQTQTCLRVGQGNFFGMRAKIGMLRVEQQLQALRAVGHKQGLQGAQVQLLHVQTIPDLLA